jgi:hypothetical protein
MCDAATFMGVALQSERDHGRDGAAWQRENVMAVNKPVGDNARKGAVKKRTQLFMAVKKPAKKKKAAKKIQRRAPRESLTGENFRTPEQPNLLGVFILSPVKDWEGGCTPPTKKASSS